jgi:hypothetical protein
MRPGQLEPNEFEIAILSHMVREFTDVGLSIAALHVLERSFTGVGSFTTFLIKDWPKDYKRRILEPSIGVTIPSLKRGLGVVAFLESDKLVLETFSYDEFWDGVFEGFKIETIQIHRF